MNTFEGERRCREDAARLLTEDELLAVSGGMGWDVVPAVQYGAVGSPAIQVVNQGAIHIV
jgi:hypothetical protein